VSTRTPNNPGTYKVYGDAVDDILTSAQRHGVDPWVALALAQGEGGFNYGSVGDGGTSFGPYQLHEGGALPPGRTAAWANSPAGIDYAMRGIAAAVGTRTGRAGIQAGVTGFERPAAPTPEIDRDVSWLSQQLAKAKGRPPIPASTDSQYHPITSAQESLDSSLAGTTGIDIPNPISGITSAIGSAVSGAEDFLLRAGKVLLGILLLVAVGFIAVKM
jgi:hypothetical protein